MTYPNGRALTPSQKREVVERILSAWERVPDLRLGQLIEQAVRARGDLFYVEDHILVLSCENEASEIVRHQSTREATERRCSPGNHVSGGEFTDPGTCANCGADGFGNEEDEEIEG